MLTALIVDALEVVVDLHHHGELAQVGSDRLVRCQQLENLLFDPHLPVVDAGVARDHLLGQAVVLVDEGAVGVGDRFFDGRSHFQELALQFLDLVGEL